MTGKEKHTLHPPHPPLILFKFRTLNCSIYTFQKCPFSGRKSQMKFWRSAKVTQAVGHNHVKCSSLTTLLIWLPTYYLPTHLSIGIFQYPHLPDVDTWYLHHRCLFCCLPTWLIKDHNFFSLDFEVQCEHCLFILCYLSSILTFPFANDNLHSQCTQRCQKSNIHAKPFGSSNKPDMHMHITVDWWWGGVAFKSNPGRQTNKRIRHCCDGFTSIQCSSCTPTYSPRRVLRV